MNSNSEPEFSPQGEDRIDSFIAALEPLSSHSESLHDDKIIVGLTLSEDKKESAVS